MKRLLAVAVVLMLAMLLSGCGRDPMSRPEVIQAYKDCREAEMSTRVIHNLNNDIVDVQCLPPGEPEERKAPGE